jgi:hypothetical protein
MTKVRVKGPTDPDDPTALASRNETNLAWIDAPSRSSATCVACPPSRKSINDNLSLSLNVSMAVLCRNTSFHPTECRVDCEESPTAHRKLDDF